MVLLKASINGPNRRRNRVGDDTVATNFTGNHDGNQTSSSVQHDTLTSSESSSSKSKQTNTACTLSFRVKSLDKFLEKNKIKHDENNCKSNDLNIREVSSSHVGNACVFSMNSTSGKALINEHHRMITGTVSEVPRATTETVVSTNDNDNDNKSSNSTSSDPILIHFHDIPIFIVRAIPLPIGQLMDGRPVIPTKNIPKDYIDDSAKGENENSDEKIKSQEEDIIYLSQVHCHNNKICEDSIYTIACCSRPSTIAKVTTSSASSSNHPKDYDVLSIVGIEIFPRYSIHDTNTSINMEQLQGRKEEGNEIHDRKSRLTFHASEISKELMNQTYSSILTVNECMVIQISNIELVCRVAKVCIQKFSNDAILIPDSCSDSGDNNCFDDDNYNDKRLSNDDSDMPRYQNTITLAAEADALYEPYRGRVIINTEFYISSSSNSSSFDIVGSKIIPAGKLPNDVIHITTSDHEWFPVRSVLLAPCIKLTKYVQAGRGKYIEIPTLTKEERSPDAPTEGEDDGRPHCKINIDCCTFDRVLVYIMSILYPLECKFALDLSEVNNVSHAADELGLQSLSDLCASQLSSFISRVRKEKYIRFSEVKKRNESNELLIILDGMVLDITRWIDEHPGGPSIIPSQALNIDCTCFFEMYHVSRQSFLYLKSFYIGELLPADLSNLPKNDIIASEGFLHSLRTYTDQWRVKVQEKVDENIHKSL